MKAMVLTRFGAPEPKSLSHEQAAAIPLAGGTAYEAIVRRLQVKVGETVLIHGGAGGVGSFAVQLAKQCGARVIATASHANQKLLRELGADVCVDYRNQSFAEIASRETQGAGVDAVFDTVGGDLIAQSTAVVRPSGRLATILGPQGDLTPLYLKNQTLYGVFLTRERQRLIELARIADRGQLKPVVAETLPLEQVHKAHQRLDTGHGAGKVILRVA